ncbi:MAG: hypothetical protein QXW58_04435 [Thermosphaera sp.]
MIRDLAELLTIKPSSKSFGLVTRVTTPLSVIIFSLAAALLKGPSQPWFYLLALVFTGSLLAYSTGLSKLFKGIQLILLFIALGVLVNIISIVTGLTPLSIEKILIGAVRLSTIAFSAILLVQWVRIEEWMYLLSKAGLNNVARALALSIIQLPLTLAAFSEASLSIRLKYGGRNIARMLHPLILHALYTARNISESLLIYGFPEPAKPVLFRRSDVLLIALLIGLGSVALI